VNRIFTGLVAGLASTVCMTIWEAFFYRRYGLEACLDWEINQHLISRANGREPAANLGLGLALHGFVGAVAGGAFASLRPRMLLAEGVGFGIVLWMLLLPLRRISTGRRLAEGSLGKVRVFASLAGHLIYGAALAATVASL
jgi:hypothetical protein